MNMKVLQPKLTLGTEGKVLINATNLKSKSNSARKKRKGENIENANPQKLIRKDGIYCDPQTPARNATLVDSSTQTDSSSNHNEKNEVNTIQEMLTSKHPPPQYWKSLAEKRGKTLRVTLEENQVLKEENDFLKGENKILEEMLEEAKQLAALVQEVTNDSVGSDDELLDKEQK